MDNAIKNIMKRILYFSFFFLVFFSINKGLLAQSINLGKEITIVAGSRTVLTPTLDKDLYYYYRWQPAINISDSTAIYPLVWPDTTTTYTLMAYRQGGDNLIHNGNFEEKDFSFRSNYLYTAPTDNALYPEGVYAIVTDAQKHHIYFKSHHDHTYDNGKGHYMAVNGKMSPGATVWEQQIDEIQPETDYIFSVWVVTLKANTFMERAILQFNINGRLIEEPFIAPYPDSRSWEQFSVRWNSGESTLAVIKILNLNTDADGNDFGLDDISFVPIVPDKGSIKVKVTPKQDKSSEKAETEK